MNNSAAISNLGFCYEYGTGCSKDDKKSAELFRKATDLGNEIAKKNLDNLKS